MRDTKAKFDYQQKSNRKRYTLYHNTEAVVQMCLVKH